MGVTIAVAGAGFSGAVVARELAAAGFAVEVFDARAHTAGNCHTERDIASGVMVHTYGPHIFHTNDDEVWRYIGQFDEMVPFRNRVKAVTGGRVFSLPINLLTINSFFGKTLNPGEASAFIAGIADRSIQDPKNFEEQALRYVGRELYEAFFKTYTIKQWGIDPRELPASILKRLPLRFNYDDNYYDHRHQGIPRHGYTYIVDRMLDHPNITLRLGTRFERGMKPGYAHVFFSGVLDGWFDYCAGRLDYRTLDFTVLRESGDYQGNAVINFCDATVPWTRVTEHKHFAPWEQHEQTIVYREVSRAAGRDDIPFYPLHHPGNAAMVARYADLALAEPATTFLGRLGTFRYLDMDVTIAEALAVARRHLQRGGA